MTFFILWFAIGLMNTLTWEIQLDNRWYIGNFEIPILKIQYALIWIVLLAQILKNYGAIS